MRPLPLWLRLAVYCGLGVLWLSGTLVFALQHLFRTVTEFGAMPHPWQAPALTIHGLLAVPVVYLLGWMSARHVGEAWRRGGNRASGLVLLALSVLLAVSGFAAYYLVADALRTANGWFHGTAGVILILAGPVHWIAGSRRRRSRC